MRAGGEIFSWKKILHIRYYKKSQRFLLLLDKGHEHHKSYAFHWPHISLVALLDYEFHIGNGHQIHTAIPTRYSVTTLQVHVAKLMVYAVLIQKPKAVSSLQHRVIIFCFKIAYRQEYIMIQAKIHYNNVCMQVLLLQRY